MATCLLLACFFGANGQNKLKGIIVGDDSEKPLQGVLIKIKNISPTHSKKNLLSWVLLIMFMR